MRGLFHWLPPVSDSLLVPLQTVPVHFACSLYSACPVNAALYSVYALVPEKKKKLVFTLVFRPMRMPRIRIICLFILYKPQTALYIDYIGVYMN